MAKKCAICNNNYIDSLSACPKEECIATVAAAQAAAEAAAQAAAEAVEAAAQAVADAAAASKEINAPHRKKVRKPLPSGQFK